MSWLMAVSSSAAVRRLRSSRRHVIALALGLPTQELRWFHTAAVKLTTGGTRPEDATEAVRDIEAVLRPLIAERRARPGRDLISVITQGEVDEDGGASRRLDDEEVLTFCKLLLES